MSTTEDKEIVLKEGAPPLSELHMEVRVRYVHAIDVSPEAIVRHYGEDDPLIGRPLKTVLDIVNEERLMALGGEQSIFEVIEGVEFANEVDRVPDDQKQRSWAEWEWVLCDETGRVWSEMVTDAEPSEYSANAQTARDLVQQWGPWGPDGRPES